MWARAAGEGALEPRHWGESASSIYPNVSPWSFPAITDFTLIVSIQANFSSESFTIILLPRTQLPVHITSHNTKMKGIEIKEYVKVPFQTNEPPNVPLTRPLGARRPQSPRPSHPHSQTHRIPHRHPRLCHKLLRPPPNPWKIPTPAGLSLDRRLGVLRRRPKSPHIIARRQDAQVQRRR